MMIRYASMKYAEIDTEVYRAQRLRNVFIDNQPMHSFSAAFLERTTNEIMLYTDGLPETTNPQGEEMGVNRVMQFLQQRAPQNIKEMIDE